MHLLRIYVVGCQEVCVTFRMKVISKWTHSVFLNCSLIVTWFFESLEMQMSYPEMEHK